MSSSQTSIGSLFSTASAANAARRFIRGRQLDKRAKPSPVVKVTKAPRKTLQSPKRDQVAELLSSGMEFDQIAERVGITVNAARRHFERIRKGLGPQAC